MNSFKQLFKRQRRFRAATFHQTHVHCTNAEHFSTEEGSKMKSFEDVPGPKPLPLVGNLWRYLPYIGEYSFRNIFKTYEKMHKEYGPLVREQILGDDVLLHVFDPQDMMKVYLESGKFPMRRSHGSLARYRKERPHLYKSTGLFPSNGEEWHRFRKLFAGLLMHTNTANAYVGMLEDITEDMVSRIYKILNDKQEVDLLPELFRWALECIGAITLNRRLGCLSFDKSDEAENLVKAAHDTHRAVYITEIFQFLKSFNTPSYKSLVRAQDYLSNTVDKYMRQAVTDREKLKENYLLSRMFANKDADYEDIFTMVLDMFLAGIDTSAYTTGFCLYNLCKNQNVQEKLRRELISNLPNKTSRLDKKLEELPYLHSVYKESLRMNPVAIGNGRVTTNEVTLSGYKIPANTNVILQHQVASLQEKNFLDAKSFIPERWTDPSRKLCSSHPVTSVAFGFGSRSCIGKRFAQREMLLAIGKLVRNFKIEYHYEDIDFITQLINVPDKPFKFRFLPLKG